MLYGYIKMLKSNLDNESVTIDTNTLKFLHTHSISRLQSLSLLLSLMDIVKCYWKGSEDVTPEKKIVSLKKFLEMDKGEDRLEYFNVK